MDHAEPKAKIQNRYANKLLRIQESTVKSVSHTKRIKQERIDTPAVLPSTKAVEEKAPANLCPDVQSAISLLRLELIQFPIDIRTAIR